MTDQQTLDGEQNGGANLNTPDKLNEIALSDDPSIQDLLAMNEDQLLKLATGEELDADPANTDSLPKELTDAVEGLADGTGAPDGNPAPQSAPTSEPAVHGKVPFIPKPRFDEVNEQLRIEREERRKSDERAAELARQLGQRETAQSSAPTAPAQPAAPQIDPVDVLNQAIIRLANEKEQKELDIAREYDKGKMSEEEKLLAYRKLEKEYAASVSPLYNQRNQIIERKNAPDPEILEKQILEDPWLVSQTEQLIKANPWLSTVNEELYATLEEAAYKRLQAEGKNIAPDVAGTWLLRQKIAEVGASFGLAGSTATPAQQPAAPLSREAQQRLDKINLANNHPPSLAAVGAAVPYQPDITIDEKTDPKKLAETLTEEQLVKLTTGGY